MEGGRAAGREKREELVVNKTWTTLLKKDKKPKKIPSFFLPPIFFIHYFIFLKCLHIASLLEKTLFIH